MNLAFTRDGASLLVQTGDELALWPWREIVGSWGAAQVAGLEARVG